eukprot:gene6795-7569_t
MNNTNKINQKQPFGEQVASITIDKKTIVVDLLSKKLSSLISIAEAVALEHQKMRRRSRCLKGVLYLLVAVSAFAIVNTLRNRKSGYRCRTLPYTSEVKHVGYAGQSAQSCLIELGCTYFIENEADTDPHNWDMLWTFKPQHKLPCPTILRDRGAAALQGLPSRQFVNHCYHSPSTNIAGRKSAQYLLFDGMRMIYGPELYFDYFPKTWILPDQKGLLLRRLRSVEYNGPVMFILKPDSGSGGKGVQLLDKQNLQSLLDTELEPAPAVLQEYISNVFTLQSYKHHIRLYLVTTSIDPIHAFLFHDGLVLFAGAPFDIHDIENLSGHITNSAFNKLKTGDCHLPLAIKKIVGKDDLQALKLGCAMSLQTYLSLLSLYGHSADTFMSKISEILNRVVFSSPTVRKVNHAPELHTPDNPMNDYIHKYFLQSLSKLLFSVPLQPFHSIAKSEQIHLSSSWRLFHSCSARADEDAYTVIQSKCKSNGESVQSTLPQCISDEVIYTLFQQCLQQQNHLFKDIMLNCHYHTALKEFQQWRHEHAALLCCCRSYRRK